MTEVSILGEKLFINGEPTYSGRFFDGFPVEGLLFNVRAVQATFDDLNPTTRQFWMYPDTYTWDPERNTNDFILALPSWKEHGVLGFTINFQGGGARYIPEIYNNYLNSAFTLNGDIRADYAERISRVLFAADQLGMVVIVGFFYWKQANKMTSENAIWNAVENGMQFIKSTGRKNILVEIANETDVPFLFPIFKPQNAHKIIEHFKNRYPEFLISTSQGGINPETGQGIPTPEMVQVCDFLLPHGNGATPQRLSQGIDLIRSIPVFQKSPKPIIINEDSTGIENLDTAFRNYVSWGYYDQGYNGEPRIHDIWVTDTANHQRETQIDLLSGFQTPPVNWTINTPRKKRFFERVAQITGFKQIDETNIEHII